MTPTLVADIWVSDIWTLLRICGLIWRGCNPKYIKELKTSVSSLLDIVDTDSMLLFYLETGASNFQTSAVQNKNAIFFMLEKKWTIYV